MGSPRAEVAEGAEFNGSGRSYGSVENEITDRVIAAAIEVHRTLGAGLLESVYEECLCYELSRMGLKFQRQLEDRVIVELKTVDDLAPVHHAQLLTYLRAADKPVGLLINFHVPVLRN